MANKLIKIPEIKFKIDDKLIKISDLTFLHGINFDETEYKNFYLKEYVIVKDRDIKLLLINLAMRYYENYTYFFEQSNNVVPFWKNIVHVKRHVISHLSPERYWKYITDNLNEDWYVRFCHNSFVEHKGETNFPEIWIIPKSELTARETECGELKIKTIEIFKEYVVQKYTHNFDTKTNTLRGKVIIISKGGSGISDKYGLWFDYYYLFTANCLTNAFLEQASKSYLQEGIYDIEAKYVCDVKNFGIETSGFIIKKAQLVKAFGESTWKHKKHIVRHLYQWGWITDATLIFNKFIKGPAIIFTREVPKIIVSLVIAGIILLIIWATIIKPLLS